MEIENYDEYLIAEGEIERKELEIRLHENLMKSAENHYSGLETSDKIKEHYEHIMKGFESTRGILIEKHKNLLSKIEAYEREHPENVDKNF